MAKAKAKRQRSRTPAEVKLMPENQFVFRQPDWDERLIRGQSPFDYDNIKHLLNKERAERALSIFNRLRVPDLVGQPTNDEACGDWFKDFVYTIAGGWDPATQKQAIQQSLLLVPKKNGKSSSSAGLALTLMLISERPNAEFVIVAPTQAISEISFSQASGVVQADPVLRERLKIKQHLKQIIDTKTGCRLSVKSFDPNIVTGVKASFVLVDECHLLNSETASRVVGQLRGSSAAIRESQIVFITTHSDKPESGFWRQELKKAREVRDGLIEVEHYLPVTYEVPPRFATPSKAFTPEVLSMTNPNIGRSVSLEWLISSAKEAVTQGESEVRRWLSQHANLQISGFASTEDQWPGAEVWGKRGMDIPRSDKPSPPLADSPSLQYLLERSDSVAMGFDGGGADDLSSIAVIGMRGVGEEQELLIWTHSFVYPIALERRKSIAGLLLDAQEQGELTICEAGEDIRAIVDLVRSIDYETPVVGFGVDPNGIAQELGSALLDAEALPASDLVSVSQGYKLRAGWLALERALRRRKATHFNQLLLNWCVSNTRQDPLTGLVTKKKSGVGKIDPIVAVATAMMVVIEAPVVYSYLNNAADNEPTIMFI